MSELQLKRGTAALVTAATKLAGQPFVVTDVPGQIRVGVDGSAAELVIADTVGNTADFVALLALTTTKQGDVYITLDDSKVFKRVTIGDGLVTLVGDWQRIGSAVDAAGIVEFVANTKTVTTPPADGDGTTATLAATVNAMSWVGHANGHEDIGFSGNLRIETNEAVTFVDGSSTSFQYIGPKPVSLGAVTGALDYRVAVAGDFDISGAQNFDDVYNVADETALLALAAKQGDVAIRADNGVSYKLSTQDPTQAVNWIAISGGGAPLTTEIVTEAAVILGPYGAGDVRVLTVSEGTLYAGSYKCILDRLTADPGTIADFIKISTDDNGVLV